MDDALLVIRNAGLQELGAKPELMQLLCVAE